MGWATTGFFQPSTAAFEVGSFEKTAAHAAAKWLGGTVVGLASPSVSFAVQVAYLAVQVADLAVQEVDLVDQADGPAVQAVGLAVWAGPWLGQVEEVVLVVVAVQAEYHDVQFEHQVGLHAEQVDYQAVQVDHLVGHPVGQFDHQVVLTAVQVVRDDLVDQAVAEAQVCSSAHCSFAASDQIDC